jgi:hypothetical protein
VATRVSVFSRACALALLSALVGLGCGRKPEADVPKVPTLRFAGVDLEYALERIATEAGWVLCLDEISSKDLSPDLALIRVDMDLPAATLDQTLRRLRDSVGTFEYQLENGVVYVRSNSLIKDKTALDQPMLNGGHFSGELGELVIYIMREHPTSFIRVQRVMGGFTAPRADVEIPKNASVKDALVAYARAAKAGWLIRRQREFTRDAKGSPAIMGTTIEARAPRPGITRLPVVYNRMSGTSALADASARMSQPFVIFDRSVLQDTRGILNFVLQADPKWELDRTLKALGESGFGPTSWHFHWRMEDGVPVLRTNHFLYFLRGRDFLSAPLLGGDFEGSLPELARWLNTHQKSPSGEVLMGGEIADSLPKGKIHVESGQNIQHALVAFAKASGVSPYVVVLDMLSPVSGKMIEHSGAWRGAYLQDLSEWKPQPGDYPVYPASP